MSEESTGDQSIIRDESCPVCKTTERHEPILVESHGPTGIFKQVHSESCSLFKSMKNLHEAREAAVVNQLKNLGIKREECSIEYTMDENGKTVCTIIEDIKSRKVLCEVTL